MLKKVETRTPSQRNLIKIKSQKNLKPSLLKHKILGIKTNSGRNNRGRITISHKGGGHKRKYKKIEFFLERRGTEIITSIEYDPNRNAYVASSYNYRLKSYQYLLAPKNLKVGDIVKSGLNAETKIGHSLPISKIPIGSLIHNISKTYGKKAQISRSAGTFSRLIEKTTKYGRILLSSGKQQIISVHCFATLGVISNDFYFLTTRGKAGRTRWLNQRPTVRGVAMNPVDHPHGGGEGKTSGGRPSVTPWGKPSKGIKTSRSINIIKN